MILLGLAAGFHDAAAALVIDGEVVAAVEQERVTRVKHDPSFPDEAAERCLEVAGIDASAIDAVTFHEKPLGVINRHLATKLAAGPMGVPGLLATTPRAVGEQLSVPARISRWFRRLGAIQPPTLFAEHHTSHLAAAFYPSPFADAAVLAVDGVGEWGTCAMGTANGRRITVEREIRFPNSLGLLYSAFTAYCGFPVNSGEGQLMGLAPFGEPVFADLIRDHLVQVAEDGSFRINQRYFSYVQGRRMTNSRFDRLFGGSPRPMGHLPGQREADIAASIQVVTEEVLLKLAEAAFRMSESDRLCLGGGVALNCVANGRLLAEGPFQDVWVQPAPGDAGSAIGAALWTWHEILEQPRRAPARDGMSGSFLGPSYRDDEIASWLDSLGVGYERFEDESDRCRAVAHRLTDGDIVGWFVGRMEFGPRALGHRSILADPRSPTVQGRLNSLVKQRASFRPFAPAILAERWTEWFEPLGESPYMSFAVRLREDRRFPQSTEFADPCEKVAGVRSDIPAVTHVDYSARVQAVDGAQNPEFACLLRWFEQITGLPILLNTSFNGANEPIVCTPADALDAAGRLGLDLLVLESFLVDPNDLAPQ